MGTIITFSILFDFDDKNCSSFWTNNEKAGNLKLRDNMCEKSIKLHRTQEW